MQRIERYGVIALVFLLVTVAAVSFWGDNSKNAKGKKGEETARNAKTEAPVVPPRQEAQRPAGKPVSRTNETKAPLPLGQLGENAPATASGDGRSLSGMVELDPVPPEPKSEPRDEDRRGDSRRERETNPVEAPPVREEKRAEAPKRGAQLDPAEMELVGVKPTPRATTVEYVVKEGDTLSGIALATLGSTRRWPEIQAINANLDPASLQAGRTILLPKGAVFPVSGGSAGVKSSANASPNAPAKPKSESGSTYVVKAGDLLSTIAERQLGAANRWREIVELNPGVDPKRLFVGTELKMPAGSSAAPSATVAQADAPRRAPREKEFKVR